jgi:hypothetical protein
MSLACGGGLHLGCISNKRALRGPPTHPPSSASRGGERHDGWGMQVCGRQ